MNPSKRNLYILTFVLFVVMLGYGIVIPILPFYIESIGAGGTELGLLVASYAVMRLIFGPIWGGLSDRLGRKPILLVGILGYAVTMVWFGLATQLWMLFAARILAGILSSATAPTTMAFIGDSTPEKERGGGMGLLGAAGGIGTIVGPVLGGFLAGDSLATPFFLAAGLLGAAGGIGTIVGPVLGGFLAGDSLATPFFLAAGLSVLSLLLAIAFLPESLPAEARQTIQKNEKLIDLKSWGQAIISPIGSLLALTFISTCGLMIFANVFGLYALEKFSFGPEDVGVMMMVLGLVSAVTQGLLAGPATKKWGDGTIIKIGLFGTAIGYSVMLLANTYTTILLATAFFALTVALQIPALTSLTSRRATVPQGIAMGLSNSFVSLGRIVGPILGGLVLDIDLSLPYLSGAIVMLAGFAFSLFWIRPEGQIVQTA